MQVLTYEQHTSVNVRESVAELTLRIVAVKELV
jgi:hypothetical protein